jgi:branched-chain amino acid transport system substrate-binding protein
MGLIDDLLAVVPKSIAATQMNTIVGPIKYNDKNYSETPLVGGQWVKGFKWRWTLEIVYNKEYPEISKTAEMTFPIPK